MIKRMIRSLDNSRRSTDAPDVILHIGAPKCGSSAIQRLCMAYRSDLLEHGYYYPKHSLDKNGVSGGHTQFAGALVNGKKEHARNTFHSWLGEARSKKATLLISAEALYGQHAALQSLCSGLRVSVIAFLRHPVDYLLGNHNQGIKRHMSTQRLANLLPEALSRPTRHLVGEPLLDWADAFGDDQCRFMAYHSPRDGGAPIEKSFLDALGLNNSDLIVAAMENAGTTNRSYVKTALELKRLLNTVLSELPDTLAHQIDWCLQGYSDRATHECGYTMADLSKEVRDRLFGQLLSQMKPVVERFPALQPVSEIANTSHQREENSWLDLETPLAVLKQEVPDAYMQIHRCATHQRDQGRRDYSFCKLLEVLGIDFIEPQSTQVGLSLAKRQALANSKFQEADYLREMAVLLESQGCLEDAALVIGRALEKRPKGVEIQRIKARVDKKVETYQVIKTDSSTSTALATTLEPDTK